MFLGPLLSARQICKGYQGWGHYVFEILIVCTTQYNLIGDNSKNRFDFGGSEDPVTPPREIARV